MPEITIDAVFVRMLLDGAYRHGLDCDPILLGNGVSRLGLDKPGTRVKLESFAAVAVEIMRQLDDEYLGLGDKRQPLGSFNMSCRACISARDITRSFKRYANFWNLFDNTFDHQVIEDDEHFVFQITPKKEVQLLNNYLVEASLSTAHRFHCWLGGQFIPLTRVSMQIAEPIYANQYQPLFYGTPIDFESPVNAIEFSAKHAKLEIVQTPETLDQYLSGKNLSLLYQPKNYRVISDQVRQWLERNIKRGNYKATLAEAARHFEMSQQVLHRRLQQEDLSFKEIKMQTRRDIAVNLLFENKLRIEEIAQQVGFSEPSAFIRAFKAWTGTTPLAYRRRKR